MVVSNASTGVCFFSSRLVTFTPVIAAEIGLTGKIGVPAGRMKYSLNAGVYWRFGKMVGFHPEIRLKNFFAFSCDEELANNRQGLNVSSLFLLIIACR